MFNKRLIAAVPEVRKMIGQQVLWQWLGMLCSVGSTLLLCLIAVHLANGIVFEGKIWAGAALLLGMLALLKSVCARQAARCASQSALMVKRTFRSRLFAMLSQMGAGYRACVNTGQASSLLSEGVSQLETYFAQYLPQFFYALLAPLTLFFILVFWSWQSALVLLIAVPLIPASIIAVQKFAKRLLAKYWDSYTGLSDSFLENLQGLTTLKVFDADERRHLQMNEEAEMFRKVTMRVLIMQLNSISVMDLVAYGGAAAGILCALFSYQAGTLSLFKTMAVILLSAEFFLPMRLLGSYFHISMNGSAAADRMFEILDAPVLSRPERMEQPFEGIQAENLTFSYPDAKTGSEKGQTAALQKVSFDLPKTGLIGITGQSGSGKSTLVRLLEGQMAADTGTLALCGQTVWKTQPDSLYEQMTVCSGDAALFEGSVREALLDARKDASDAQMIEALKQASLWNTLQKREGLETQIGERGGFLSGGQKQRLALARALLKDAPVLVLDEATSAMDGASENRVMENLRQLSQTRLILCASHRLANLELADRILVFDRGRLAESGTHAQLIENNGGYARLYQAQQALEAYASFEEEEME